MRKFALFAFDSFYPTGGWNDLYGLYETRADAEQVARESHRSYDHWELVDLETGEMLWEQSGWQLNPCHGREHDWGAWKKIERPTPRDIALLDPVTYNPMMKKEPTKYRECKLCGQYDDDGEYNPILPPMTPMRNLMPRVR